MKSEKVQRFGSGAERREVKMSSKLLYSLSDEKTDLHKQIGCMNGIFQLFDRHHFLSPRRLKHDSTKRLLPGQSDNKRIEANNAIKGVAEEDLAMVKEKQRISTESSRTSFSSSSCSSSFSSLDYNRTATAQLERSYNQATTFPGTPSRDMVIARSNASQLENNGGRGLVVKTATKGKSSSHRFKHADSPRPSPKSKSSKLRASNESTQFLANLGEMPRNSRYDKGGSQLLAPRESARLSYDERDLRDSVRSSLRELPRLSLDSKQRSLSYHAEDMQRGKGASSRQLGNQQEPGNHHHQRTSSVVAKLMGLEDFSTLTSCNEIKTVMKKTYSEEQYAPSKSLDEKRQNQTSRASFFKNNEAQKDPSNSCPSVYGEIEKRLAELEFQKSGRDLRALKQILEAMQKTKERLETRSEGYISRAVSHIGNYGRANQSLDLESPRTPPSNSTISAIVKRTSSPRSSKSNIVVMKSARATEKAGSSASMGTISHSSSRHHKFGTGDSVNSRKELASTNVSGSKELVKKQTNEDLSPRKNILRDFSGRTPSSWEKKPFPKAPERSKAPQQIAEESSTSSSRSSSCASPRLQQKKLGLEKHSYLTSASSDPSRTRRNFSAQPIESGSPRRKLKPKIFSLLQDGIQLNKTMNSKRDQIDQGSIICHQSSTTISSAFHIETEDTNTTEPDKISCSIKKQDSPITTNPGMISGRSMERPVMMTLEQPSPVSVLEAPFYEDESPSPVRMISNVFRDGPDDAEWSLVSQNHLSRGMKSSLHTDVSHTNTGGIQNSIRYLEEIMTHEKSIANFSTRLSGKTNPDHNYILEIMSAAGLLKDIDNSVRHLQIHPSGHLVDPNLFILLEENKICTQDPKHKIEKQEQSYPRKKIQRRLIFDAVNELLFGKLVLDGSQKQWSTPNKMATKKMGSDRLLGDLCSEIDQLQNSWYCVNEDEDILKSIQCQDLKNEPVAWTDYEQEISGLVLDVERLIFKDLINEIVSGEGDDLQSRAGRLCRQLFC